jgi:2-polyprenyl-6-methoxyphenol hydroxylase-like FAD-dependent oxidoreductase
MQFTPEDSPYGFVAMVPQDVTEKLLVDELQRKGGAVDYETTFVSAVPHDDFVNVTLDQKGRHVEWNAAFVVGCDGAHSTVRHLLDLPFEGAQYDDTFLLADIETNEALAADEMQLCPNEGGPLAIFPMSATRRRMVATVEKAEDEAPSLELVRKLLAERAPTGIEARALQWSSYFHIHHRQVGQLRVGRMFLAGDAAHIHSPFGAQGMNTGLQDVWNLVWKLDLAARGHATEELLDSYTAERVPVIKHVIDVTHFMTKAMGTPSKLAQTVRDVVIPVVSRLAPFQHGFVQTLSELGIAYRGSPIVEGAGARYFDDSIRGGKGILSRFLLVCGNDGDSTVKEAARRLAESRSQLVEFRSARQQDIMLVRPDGYIAYSAKGRDGTAALEPLRAVLERQTR